MSAEEWRPESDRDGPAEPHGSWRADLSVGGIPEGAYTALPDSGKRADRTKSAPQVLFAAAALIGFGYLMTHLSPPVPSVPPPIFVPAPPPLSRPALPAPPQAIEPIAQAQSSGLWGSWSGAYFYPSSQAPVPFTVVFDGAGGRIDEPATFGDGSSPNLSARVIDGSLAPGGRVAFSKVYDGTGGVTHLVFYTGLMSVDSLTIQGTWMLGQTSGGFKMTRGAAASLGQ